MRLLQLLALWPATVVNANKTELLLEGKNPSLLKVSRITPVGDGEYVLPWSWMLSNRLRNVKIINCSGELKSIIKARTKRLARPRELGATSLAYAMLLFLSVVTLSFPVVVKVEYALEKTFTFDELRHYLIIILENQYRRPSAENKAILKEIQNARSFEQLIKIFAPQ